MILKMAAATGFILVMYFLGYYWDEIKLILTGKHWKKEDPK